MLMLLYKFIGISKGCSVIHHKNLSIDCLGLIAGKEQNGIGLIHHIGLRQRQIHMLSTFIGKPGGKGSHLLRCVEWGGGRAGAYGIAADSLACKLNRHILGKAQNAGLCSGVGNTRAAEHAADGGHVDNGAALAHVGQYVLRQIEQGGLVNFISITTLSQTSERINEFVITFVL